MRGLRRANERDRYTFTFERAVRSRALRMRRKAASWVKGRVCAGGCGMCVEWEWEMIICGWKNKTMRGWLGYWCRI